MRAIHDVSVRISDLRAEICREKQSAVTNLESKYTRANLHLENVQTRLSLARSDLEKKERLWKGMGIPSRTLDPNSHRYFQNHRQRLRRNLEIKTCLL